MDAAKFNIEEMQPLVSVIMSVYNGELFLQKAVDSILNQTYSSIQFIIVDDDSNEATKNILHSIQDNRVEIIYNKSNLGLTANLNKSLLQCKGNYIARMDADDISLPDRILKQVLFLEQNQTIAGTAGWIDLINEDDKNIGNWADDRNYNTARELKTILPKKNVIAHPTIMLRSGIMQKYKYNEAQKHSQDWDLWLRLFADDLVIEKMKEVVLLYRVHSNSITHENKNKGSFKKKNETYFCYIQNIKKWNNFNKEVKKAFVQNKIKLFFSNLKRSVFK